MTQKYLKEHYNCTSLPFLCHAHDKRSAALLHRWNGRSRTLPSISPKFKELEDDSCQVASFWLFPLLVAAPVLFTNIDKTVCFCNSIGLQQILQFVVMIACHWQGNNRFEIVGVVRILNLVLLLVVVWIRIPLVLFAGFFHLLPPLSRESFFWGYRHLHQRSQCQFQRSTIIA